MRKMELVRWPFGKLPQFSFFCFNGDGDINRTSWGGKPNQTDILSRVASCPESHPVPLPPNKNKRTEFAALSSCLNYRLNAAAYFSVAARICRRSDFT